MRVFALSIGLIAIVALGAVQVTASVVLRASAERPAWASFVPSSLAARADAIDSALPLPWALRLVLARHALARGNLTLAARDTARLPPSRDRLVLEGKLAQARGDRDGAVRAFLAAGDISDLDNAAEALAERGDVAGALALAQAAIARLQHDRTQADALAEAYFHLGRLLQTRAYGLVETDPLRRVNELSAATAYARAAALAPLSVRYLVGLGNQQLNLAELDAAERTFARAHDIDPTSAEPLAGLADAALRRNDTAAARAYVLRARALDPSSDAVRRVAHRLGG